MPREAARAGQAQPRYPQFHRVFEQRQVPDPANGLVVDGRYRLVTARTKALSALYRPVPAPPRTGRPDPPDANPIRDNPSSHPAWTYNPLPPRPAPLCCLEINTSAGSAVRLSPLSWEKNLIFWPFGTGVTRRRGSLPRGRRRAGGARAAAPSAAGAGVRGGWRRAGDGESRARGGGAAARAQSGRAFAELDCGPPLAGVSPSSDANMLSIRGSTSRHCCGGRPMARSRIVGSSP